MSHALRAIRALALASAYLAPAIVLGQAPTLPPKPLADPPPQEQVRPIPFAGPLGPSSPPPSPAPPYRALAPSDVMSLDVLYKRPGPKGPAPIPVSRPRAIYVTSSGVTFIQLPTKTTYPELEPPALRKLENDTTIFGNKYKQWRSGKVAFLAIDRTRNDSKASKDSMAFEATLVDPDGATWRIIQTRLATLSPDPVIDPWYGGLAIDTTEHGASHRGHPAEPQTNCAMCSWGWADVYRNGTRVASSAPFHVMLGSVSHDVKNDFHYYSYDVRANPQTEVHIVVAPEANLPLPGGALHVMMEDATAIRGTPEEVMRRAPAVGASMPTITLNAVAHLKWDTPILRVKTGEPVRLIVNNLDPSSFHGFVLRTTGGKISFPLPQGDQWTTTIAFDQPGEYEYWCPVSNHRDRGMYGRVIVSKSNAGGSEGPPGKSP